MNKGFRKIDPLPFFDALGDDVGKLAAGEPPTLKWLTINELVVDPSYQRDILGTGRKNIVKIARDFDWTKFSPVIVAPVEDGFFVVVDGQHRATAAALRGIRKVPCQVIGADRRKQAAAFAAINSVTTAMSPLQVHAAKVAAGDPKATRLNRVCASAGVTICRYPVPANKMKVGETLAAGKLYQLLEKFTDGVVTTALRCITRTRKGYPGLVRAQLVEAICVNLEAEPDWLAHEAKLLAAMTRLDLIDAFSKARAKTEGSRAGVVSELVDVISAHLDKTFGAKKAA